MSVKFEVAVPYLALHHSSPRKCLLPVFRIFIAVVNRWATFNAVTMHLNPTFFAPRILENCRFFRSSIWISSRSLVDGYPGRFLSGLTDQYEECCFWIGHSKESSPLPHLEAPHWEAFPIWTLTQYWVPSQKIPLSNQSLPKSALVNTSGLRLQSR